MDANYPARLITLACTLSGVALLVSVLAGSSIFNSLSEHNSRIASLQRLGGEVLRLDEALTMSARMAAVSGDAKWIKRYQRLEPELLNAIDLTLMLADSESVREAARLAEDANQRLVNHEATAFRLIEAGDPKGAHHLLDSTSYADLKHEYLAGIEKMLHLISINDQNLIEKQKNLLLALVLFVLGIVVALLLIWASALARLRNWRNIMAEQESQRQCAEAEIVKLNNELELKVEERTKELESSQKQLQIEATTDELTGLSNRRKGMEHLGEMISQLQDTDRSVVVNVVDIDDFKTVNETLGHALGDQLIVQVASRLENNLPDNISARLDGDEFLVMSSVSKHEDENLTALRIKEQFEKPFYLEERDYEMTLSPSIGVTVAPRHGADALKLLRNADLALYSAKSNRDSGIFKYSKDMDEQRLHRREIESGLSKAISMNQLSLHYQPKFNLQSNELIGAEALLRWNHPVLGFVPPDKFIPIAEETGLILEIGNWVLSEAASQVSNWRKSHQLETDVAVNVSPLQLRQGDFLNTLQSVLQHNQLSPELLQVEVTESSLLENDRVTQEVIAGVADLGCELALDDFGTGYSALSYLKQYPFDYLKIDRSFIAGMLENEQDAAVTRAIIAMAQSLNLKVISEGTEIVEQCEALRALGCDMAQGYFYSKPLPANEFLTFAKAWSPGSYNKAA